MLKNYNDDPCTANPPPGSIWFDPGEVKGLRFSSRATTPAEEMIALVDATFDSISLEMDLWILKRLERFTETCST
jgi:hypothetical protein